MRTYVNVLKKYISKNKKTYFLLMLSLTMTVLAIAFPTVIKRSQANNKIQYIQEIAPKYDYQAIEIGYKNLKNLERSQKFSDIYSYSNQGNISLEDGFSTSLFGYNKNIFEILNYEIISGREPLRENEIILNKSTSINGKTAEINKDVDFFYEYKYKENGENKIISGKKRLKVVGLYKSKNTYEIVKYLEKMGFSDNNSFISESSNMVDKSISIYNVFLNKSDKDINSYIISEIAKVDSAKIVDNSFRQILTDTVKSQNVINKDNAIATVSIILLLISIFIISGTDKIQLVAKLEVLGGSKKKISLSILFEYVFMVLLSTIIGSSLLFIFSKLILNYVNFDVTGIKLNIDIPFKTVYLYPKDIIFCVLINCVCLLLVFLYQLYTINKYSSIVLIKQVRQNGVISKLLTRLNLGRNVKSKLSFKWIVTSLKYYIFPLIIIIMIGSSFIYVTSFEKISTSAEGEYSNIYSELVNRDYLFKSYSDSDYFGVDVDEIEYLKNRYNLSDLFYTNSRENYILESKQKISEQYMNERLRNEDIRKDLRYEIPFETISLSLNYLDGLLKSKILTRDEVEKLCDKNNMGIILVDDFYSRETQSRNNILKKANEGDYIKLKLPRRISNDKIVYIEVRAKIIKKIDRNTWSKYSPIIRELEGNIAVYDGALENFTNLIKYNRIAFNVNEKKIKDVAGEIRLSDFNFVSREDLKNEIKNERMILYFGPIILNYLISGIILVFTIISMSKIIMESRIRDFKIMRDIGGSYDFLRSILRKESVFLYVLGAVISIFVGGLKVYKDFSTAAQLELMERGLVYSKFNIDFIFVIVFLAVLGVTFGINYRLLKNRIEYQEK